MLFKKECPKTLGAYVGKFQFTSTYTFLHIIVFSIISDFEVFDMDPIILVSVLQTLPLFCQYY